MDSLSNFSKRKYLKTNPSTRYSIKEFKPPLIAVSLDKSTDPATYNFYTNKLSRINSIIEKRDTLITHSGDTIDCLIQKTVPNQKSLTYLNRVLDGNGNYKRWKRNKIKKDQIQSVIIKGNITNVSSLNPEKANPWQTVGIVLLVLLGLFALFIAIIAMAWAGNI